MEAFCTGDGENICQCQRKEKYRRTEKYDRKAGTD